MVPFACQLLTQGVERLAGRIVKGRKMMKSFIKLIIPAAAGSIVILSLAACATKDGSRIGKGEWREIEGDILGRKEYVWPEDEPAAE